MKPRNVVISLMFLLMTIFLSGCSQKIEETKTERIYKLPLGVCVVSSEAGIVHLNSSKWIMSFFDPASGVDAPLCTRINCTHDSESCDAYFPGVDFAAITGDKLYYIEWNDSFQGKNLCVADTNGTKRKLLHHMEPAQNCEAAGCEDGYLFFTYYNQYDENGNALEKENCGIYLMNLETKELEHIQMPENYQSRISKATISQGTLYYEYFNCQIDMRSDSFEEWTQKWTDADALNLMYENMRLEIWKFDLSSKENICLQSMTANQTGTLYLGYGHLLGSVPSDTRFDCRGKLENLNGKDSYELNPELIRDKSVCLCDEGVVISDEDKRQFLLWRYDTGELETLGSYEENVSISLFGITGDWVYAMKFTIPESDGRSEYIGNVYLSKEQFMKGAYKWKQLPEIH